MTRYDPGSLEPVWQQYWRDERTYAASDTSDKQPYYALSFFPYPSGAGLHIGHTLNFTITDVIARHKRMQGFEVLHPMGWDSFGLPAENYAIKTGIAPQVVTKENQDNFRRQCQALGLSIDWNREFSSTDPDYYRWTQKFFLLLLSRGLAYQKESAQFWCDICKTVLANEQVVNGMCWRHEDNPVTKKLLKQWFFKITDYADRLSNDLDSVDWPEGIKQQQRNWIGTSKGAEIDFAIHGDTAGRRLRVFTTRPDTLYGATFMVIAPEHDLARELATDDQRDAVNAYIDAAAAKTDVERQDQSRDKTGVATGSYAINPATNEQIPIWIADYVLGGYGTGAIMAVPAHDERDHAFARAYDLPIVPVIEPTTGKQQADPEFRRSIVAIVRKPATNEFLSINWGPKLGGNLFVGGGLDEGEDIVDCARREVLEETGYTNLRLVATTGRVHHSYFAYSKNVARQIEAYGVLFDLIDETKADTALEAGEQGKFSVEWLPKAAAETKVTEDLHAIFYKLLLKNPSYSGEGIMINSGSYDGMASSDAREAIVAELEQKGVGAEKINYKIRDWLISRQRYWGAPIPVVHCAEHGAVPVPDDQLPITLPDMADFAPSGDGRSPLANNEQWLNTTCPLCDGPATRETDTMDGFACSSWYFLRFADPHNNVAPFSSDLAKRWLPVNMYVGGAEHAVMHLLYARMWTKVMHDAGMIDFDEPFTALRNQGMLLAEDGAKMSKSRGNVVNPEDIIGQGYGADALRMTTLFLAPYNQSTPWSSDSLAGMYRFLVRVWALAQEVLALDSSGPDQPEVTKAIAAATKKVGSDIAELGFNTAISALMSCMNELTRIKKSSAGMSNGDQWRKAIAVYAQLLAPFAPHMTEAIWHDLDASANSIHRSSWPTYDEAVLVESTITVAVQINGKVRAELELAADVTADDAIAAALQLEAVQSRLEGKKPTRTLYVPGRLVSIVA